MLERVIPEKLLSFLRNGIKDVDDGFEYASELNRILNSDECQAIFKSKEIETMRDFADKVKKVGEINHYTEERVKEIEIEHFGSRGIIGFLGSSNFPESKWSF
jgi:hypothetical protein